MRADEPDVSLAGRTRWVSIESSWTLVLRPGSGWLSRTLAQYAGLPRGLRAASAAVVASFQVAALMLAVEDPSGAKADLLAVVNLLCTGFVVVNAAGAGSSDRAARMWACLTGGRLIAPVRLNDPVEDAQGMSREIWAHSGCLADRVVRREPHLAGVVQELLWAAAVPCGPGQHAAMRSVTTDERVDDAWKAWVQVAERALSRPAPGNDQ